ncbi:MAG: hypothetical protein CFE26_09850 [Verrucomicrobiales bacterium VVV1]|nr:MAG: hypothetical protein CFE26_09850 [Verrucomicrobiales bacterium VVV1]
MLSRTLTLRSHFVSPFIVLPPAKGMAKKLGKRQHDQLMRPVEMPVLQEFRNHVRHHAELAGVEVTRRGDFRQQRRPKVVVGKIARNGAGEHFLFQRRRCPERDKLAVAKGLANG